jgi:hypothetical protein
VKGSFDYRFRDKGVVVAAMPLTLVLQSTRVAAVLVAFPFPMVFVVSRNRVIGLLVGCFPFPVVVLVVVLRKNRRMVIGFVVGFPLPYLLRNRDLVLALTLPMVLRRCRRVCQVGFLPLVPLPAAIFLLQFPLLGPLLTFLRLFVLVRLFPHETGPSSRHVHDRHARASRPSGLFEVDDLARISVRSSAAFRRRGLGVRRCLWTSTRSCLGGGARRIGVEAASGLGRNAFWNIYCF